jgi:uncharacterized membrane protein YbaN (DUF454 family)
MDQPLPPVAFSPLSPLKRIALIALGTLTLGLGIAGMFLPGVPTTVFLLITMACYVRSSERMYRWVMTRRWLQKPIAAAQAYQRNGVLPVRIKLIAQSVAWSSFLLVVFTGAKPIFEVITLGFAASCTIAMSIIPSAGKAWSPRIWRNTAGDVMQQLWLGTLAGALAGFIFGIAAQTILRFVARLAGATLQVTLPQTLAAIMAGIVMGVLFGWLYAGVRRALPLNRWLNGGLFGALMVIVAGAALMLTSSGDMLRLFENGWQTAFITLLACAGIVAGVVTCLSFRSLEMRSAKDSHS